MRKTSPVLFNLDGPSSMLWHSRGQKPLIAELESASKAGGARRRTTFLSSSSSSIPFLSIPERSSYPVLFTPYPHRGRSTHPPEPPDPRRQVFRCPKTIISI